MAKRSGLSKSTVGRIWKAFSLKPHLSETFTLSKDPLFVEKVRDVVGLYPDPPERAVVLCEDEKSPGPGPGPVPAGATDDARHARDPPTATSATASPPLFAALDMASGTVISALHRRHRSTEYRKFLITIDKQVPAELDVHVICDNHATHKTDTIGEMAGRAR